MGPVDGEMSVKFDMCTKFEKANGRTNTVVDEGTSDRLMTVDGAASRDGVVDGQMSGRFVRCTEIENPKGRT